jgi:CRISPR-associated protein Csm4
MNTYRVRLRLRSALGTPLVADTLFGHLCWGLAYHEGSAAVAGFLQAMAGSEPPLVISDPLPAGHWPMPVLPPLRRQDYARLGERLGLTDRVALHDYVRALLRRSWISHGVFDRVAPELDSRALAAALAAERSEAVPVLVEGVSAHNTINRYSGRVRDEGGLYFTRQHHVPHETSYDVWARSSWDAKRVRQVFAWGLEGGYGRDAGTGLGQLDVEGVEVAALPIGLADRANAVLTLGNCVPAEVDPARGLWNIDVRQGRLGGAWSAAQDEETSTAFKYPLVGLARGAVLLSDRFRPTLGRVVRGIHPTRAEVVTCGYTLTLPVCVTQEFCACLPTT